MLRNHDAPITVLPAFPRPDVALQVFGRLHAPTPRIVVDAPPHVQAAFCGVVGYLEKLLQLDETLKGATFTSLTEVCIPSHYAVL